MWVRSASIVDLIKTVCLQDFQETVPPPSVNAYPLVAWISSASVRVTITLQYPRIPSIVNVISRNGFQIVHNFFKSMPMIINMIWNKSAKFAHNKRDIRAGSASQIHKRATNLRISQFNSSDHFIISKQYTRIIRCWRRLTVAIPKTTKDFFYIVRLNQSNPSLSSLTNLMFKITSVAPRSFISKHRDKKSLVFLITF
jgi:hypothetical protein